jgi:hypothetical protein
MTQRPETQEQSIKARKSLLFESETRPARSKIERKPFAVLVRETPAAPLSGGTKAILWTLTLVVIGLLVAALATSRGGSPARRTPASAKSS